MYLQPLSVSEPTTVLTTSEHNDLTVTDERSQKTHLRPHRRQPNMHKSTNHIITPNLIPAPKLLPPQNKRTTRHTLILHIISRAFLLDHRAQLHSGGCLGKRRREVRTHVVNPEREIRDPGVVVEYGAIGVETPECYLFCVLATNLSILSLLYLLVQQKGCKGIL
jgi:hypothetical protein